MAPRADCGRTFARSQNHFDAPLVATETGVLIDKTSETMATVQDRGQFHGGETSTINLPELRGSRLANLGYEAESVAQKGGFERSAASKSETAATRPSGGAGLPARCAGCSLLTQRNQRVDSGGTE